MANVYINNVIEFNQYDIPIDKDIFESILEIRKKGFDSERFFLKYFPASELSRYDFNNPYFLEKFRQIHLSCVNSIKGMGGCNLREDMLQEDIRYAGIKLSDPYGKILGIFDIRNHIVTYSPIFPFFYEQRDLIKFANDTYFTSIPFEEIIMNQINHAIEFYVHIGDYRTTREIVRYGSYILEQISKKQMIEYATNPELGKKILKKYLNL